MAYPLLAPLPAPLGEGNTVTSGGALASLSPWPNKIGGGYSRGRRQRADQHRSAGGVGEKFSGSRSSGGPGSAIGVAASELAGRLEAGIWGGAGNGGFPPFLEGASGGVGRAALEGRAQGIDRTAFSPAAHKPYRLARRRPSPRLAGRLAPIAAEAPPAPPFPPSDLRCTLGLDVFRILNRPSAPASRDRSTTVGSALPTTATMGLGVSGSPRAGSGRCGAPRQGQEGFGVGDGLSSAGLTDEAAKLARGGWHVKS